MTAPFVFKIWRLFEVFETLAFRNQLFKQSSGLEVVAHLRLKFLHLGEDLVQANRVAIEHRAATIDWPAITVDPDDIDV